MKGSKGSKILFRDTYTFDIIQNESTRTVMGMMEVIGNVGGVQQILALIFSFLVLRYN